MFNNLKKMKTTNTCKTPDEWYTNNKETLKKHKGMWIAFTKNGIISSNKEFLKMIEMADNVTQEYVIMHIHEFDFVEPVRFLPVRFRSVKSHEWQPLYSVELKFKKIKLFKMLVDSGADFTLIPKDIGLALGYSLSESEPFSKAEGIGGIVEYVLRNIEIKIDSHSFMAPMAWIQTKECSDIILGREVVFDIFNIEFLQAEEKIIFKKH